MCKFRKFINKFSNYFKKKFDEKILSKFTFFENYMQKQNFVLIGIGVAIVAVIVLAGSAYMEDLEEKKLQEDLAAIEPEWNRSGPFSINKHQYKLGEKIFMNIQTLAPGDIGLVQVIRPDGKLWINFPFNATEKDSFKKYFEPDTSRFKGLYEPEQLVGKWMILFNGTSYPPLEFEIINEYIPGAEDQIVSIPRPSQ